MQKSAANREAHVPAQDQPGEDEENAEHVQHVIHIKAVAGPLVMANSSQRAVEAVSKPVDRQEPNGHQERQARPVPVAEPGREHGHASQDREVIRVDGRRDTPGHPDKATFFNRRQEALLNPPGFRVDWIRHLV